MSQTPPPAPGKDQPVGRWRRLALVLAVIGPGIITSNVDNDAGGITTYSLAGANYGLGLLWTLAPITLILILVQEMSARMGSVTGKGLAALIRERFGATATFYLMIGLVLTNLANTVSEFAGVAAALELFGVSRYLSVPLAAIIVWILVLKASYKSVEKVFLAACLFYVAYVITGFLIKPEWGEVGLAMVKPTLSFNGEAMMMLAGLVGTTIAPWMQFYLQASVVDKGLSAKDYYIVRWDVITGSVTVSAVAFFIILVCAATLNANGVKVETAEEAARALGPLAGRYASQLFALGLLNASLFAASILPLSTAYTVCEAFGWESSVNSKFIEAPQFYSLYSFMIVIGAGVVLLPDVPLIPVMYFSQVLNGLALPVILFFMTRLVRDKAIMGPQANGRLGNIVAWGMTIVLTALSLVTVASAFLGNGGQGA